MSDDRNTLHRIAEHLAKSVEPLIDATRSVEAFVSLMHRLGWDVQSLPPSYANLGVAASDAIQAARALSSDPSLGEIRAVVDEAGAVYRALQSLGEAPAGVDAGLFLAEIAETLFEFLLVRYLVRHAPDVYSALEALGVIEHEHHPSAAGRPAYVRSRLNYREIVEVLTDPMRVPNRVYGWGSNDLDFPLLAVHLMQFSTAIGLLACHGRVEDELGEAYEASGSAPPDKTIDTYFDIVILETEIAESPVGVGLTIVELPSEPPNAAGLVVQPNIPDGISLQIPFGAGWSFRVRSDTNLAELFGIVIRPDDIEVRYPFATGSTLPAVGAGMALDYAPDSRVVVLGKAGQSRLDIAGAGLGLEVDYVSGELEFRIVSQIRDLSITVSPADVDGFLRDLFGGSDIVVPVQLDFGWSNRSGFSFMGGLGFQISVYPHLELGPIRIDRLDLAFAAALGADGPPSLDLNAAAAFSGELGPLAFSVDGLGVELKFLFQEGNAGPFDVDFDFKPPTALGIVVDAGPVTGGGFLRFDRPRGRYEGILELSIYEISVSAIGLLDTKNEAGEDLPPPGFSFLIIISVEFTPIQLGFGFTLNGVGGLAGIHRTIVTEALQAGLREGTLDHILFPQDPVRNAPQIFSDLRIVFPVAVGRFVFGPMAKLGWGTPSVITAELGIILELPDPIRIVILGQGAALLPEDAPIVRIRVDILGIIDFALEKFSIDASIRDSYVGAFALSGDIAMRLKWGGRPNFALSVGGLNPAFTPPPNFPTLRRVMISLGLGDNPRISLQGYLAVTSNSFQLGALAELYAAAGSFNVYGYLGFDALIIFDPFFFRFDFRAGFALRKGRRRIAGISVKGMLSGPSPFHVKGEGCISILFFDVCVPFDATFGNRKQVSLPEKDPWGALSAAIADQRNWAPVLPNRQSTGVTFQPTTDDRLFVHPMGRLSFRQRVVPFNKTLERFGEFAIRGANRFDISGVEIGDEPAASFTLVKDYMAPGLSEDLSDREKVTRDSFELEVVGVEAGSANAEFGAPKTKVIEYEQKIIETPWRARLLATLYTIPLTFQIAVAKAGAKARSLATLTGRTKFAAPFDRERGAVLNDEQWVIVVAETLTEDTAFGGAMSKGEALRAHKAHLQAHPEDDARLEVVSVFETREAA